MCGHPGVGELAGGTSPRGLQKQSVLGWLQAETLGSRHKAATLGSGHKQTVPEQGWAGREDVEAGLQGRSPHPGDSQADPGTWAACPWHRESRRSPLAAPCLQPGVPAACETHIVTGPSCTRDSAVPKGAVTAGHCGTASPSHARAKRSDGLAAIRGAWGRAPLCSSSTRPQEGLRYLLSTSWAPGTILCGKNIKPRGEGGAWRTWSGSESLRLGAETQRKQGGGMGTPGMGQRPSKAAAGAQPQARQAWLVLGLRGA